MEKVENLVGYAISPVAFVLIFAVGLAVGSLFIAIGAIGYIKLMWANRKGELA
jgi:hypothetical protein